MYAHLHAVDVQFWRSRKTLEGLSVRSVFFNVFQSFIVLLYILDNETNFVIIISVFVGGQLCVCVCTLTSLQTISVVIWSHTCIVAPYAPPNNVGGCQTVEGSAVEDHTKHLNCFLPSMLLLVPLFVINIWECHTPSCYSFIFPPYLAKCSCKSHYCTNKTISYTIAWCTGGLTCMYLEDTIFSNLLYGRTYNVPPDMYICAHSFYAS